jgi:phage tail protein X
MIACVRHYSRLTALTDFILAATPGGGDYPDFLK